MRIRTPSKMYIDMYMQALMQCCQVHKPKNPEDISGHN